MDATFSERQVLRQLKVRRQQSWRRLEMAICWRATSQGRVIAARTVGGHKALRLRINLLKVCVGAGSPNVLGVVLVKALDRTVAFRMTQRREDYLGSDIQTEPEDTP